MGQPGPACLLCVDTLVMYVASSLAPSLTSSLCDLEQVTHLFSMPASLEKCPGERCGSHLMSTKSNSEPLCRLNFVVAAGSPPQGSVNILFNGLYWLHPLDLPLLIVFFTSSRLLRLARHCNSTQNGFKSVLQLGPGR